MAEDAAAAEPREVASGEVDGVDGAAAAIAAAIAAVPSRVDSLVHL